MLTHLPLFSKPHSLLWIQVSVVCEIHISVGVRSGWRRILNLIFSLDCIKPIRSSGLYKLHHVWFGCWTRISNLGGSDYSGQCHVCRWTNFPVNFKRPSLVLLWAFKIYTSKSLFWKKFPTNGDVHLNLSAELIGQSQSLINLSVSFCKRFLRVTCPLSLFSYFFFFLMEWVMPVSVRDV